MELAKTYWFLNDKINQPKIDYYQHSNKTPYEKGLEALDYFRYYGGKPLNIEKTYYNRLLMPIFDDFDLLFLLILLFFELFPLLFISLFALLLSDLLISSYL